MMLATLSGTSLPTDVLDQFPGAPPEVRSVSDGNPSFWGGYIEAGYFLTGETRGYKNGAWDRTKVLQPFSKGGMGAFQINGRVDYLDLDYGKLHESCNNNFVTGVCTVSNNCTPWRQAAGLQAGLTWIPEDYVRVLLNYSHAFVTGGPFADEVENDPTCWSRILTPSDVDYGVDVVQGRFQIDF